jgi:alanine racemase
MDLIRPTWVEIDLDNVAYNFLKVKELVRGRKIIGVVKADAYGHGAIEVSKVLEEKGAYALATASLEEALNLRDSGILLPILVLGYVDPSALPLAAKKNVFVTLFDKNFVKRLKQYKGNSILNVHINVDTGMGRIGISPGELLDVVESISKLKNIRFHGLYTHFATADSDQAFTQQQLKIFNELIKNLTSKGVRPEIVHCANSAAILNTKRSYFNAVRPGILLYGLSPLSEEVAMFKPVLSFKTRTIYVKEINKGSSISYGRTFIASKKMLVATIPVGYADGLPRALSNKGEVLIKKMRARIVGNVTMDQTVIDVTNFPYIHPGNEVVLIGTQGDERITATEIANKVGTINYEIVSRIGKRVKRIFKRRNYGTKI